LFSVLAQNGTEVNWTNLSTTKSCWSCFHKFWGFVLTFQVWYIVRRWLCLKSTLWCVGWDGSHSFWRAGLMSVDGICRFFSYDHMVLPTEHINIQSYADPLTT
jgi:hypothetical protein